MNNYSSILIIFSKLKIYREESGKNINKDNLLVIKIK
jgi:hypothetical protein